MNSDAHDCSQAVLTNTAHSNFDCEPESQTLNPKLTPGALWLQPGSADGRGAPAVGRERLRGVAVGGLVCLAPKPEHAHIWVRASQPVIPEATCARTRDSPSATSWLAFEAFWILPALPEALANPALSPHAESCGVSLPQSFRF